MQLNSYFQYVLEGTLEYWKEYEFDKKNLKRKLEDNSSWKTPAGI